LLHNRIYRSEELQSKSLTESHVHKAHGGEGADPCFDLRQLDRCQVVGHNDRVLFQTRTGCQRIVQQNRYPTRVSTSS